MDCVDGVALKDMAFRVREAVRAMMAERFGALDRVSLLEVEGLKESQGYTLKTKGSARRTLCLYLSSSCRSHTWRAWSRGTERHEIASPVARETPDRARVQELRQRWR